MKFRLFFAWFDLWIGAYYDRKKKILYICPFPCIVLSIQRSEIYKPIKLLFDDEAIKLLFDMEGE